MSPSGDGCFEGQTGQCPSDGRSSSSPPSPTATLACLCPELRTHCRSCRQSSGQQKSVVGVLVLGFFLRKHKPVYFWVQCSQPAVTPRLGAGAATGETRSSQT